MVDGAARLRVMGMESILHVRICEHKLWTASAEYALMLGCLFQAPYGAVAAMPDPDTNLKDHLRRARGKFVAMASAYSLGTLNDNFFKQAAIFLAMAASKDDIAGHATKIFALPYLLFAAPAGWLADRFVKRRIVIGAKGLEVVAMLIGAVGIYYLNWPLILTMVGVMALQSAIFSPALNGSIPDLYPESYVTRANGNLRVAVTVAILLGYALAGKALNVGADGKTITSTGRLTVAIVALSVALVGLVVSFGTPRFPAKSPDAAFPWSGPWDTIRSLWRIRKDRLLAITLVCQWLFYMVAALQLLVVTKLGTQQLGLSEGQTSYLLLAQMVGIAVGGVLAGFISKGERWHRVLAPSAGGMAAGMLLVGALPHAATGVGAWVYGLLLFGVGVAGGLFLVPIESFVQVRPPEGRKGRVIACANFAAFAGILIAGDLFNLMNNALRPTACYAAMGVGMAVAAGWLVWMLRSERGGMVDG